MPIEISGTTVIDDSRNVTDVENVGDANTVYYGNGANLTGVESGVADFVATGTIPNGSTVIVNADGTVSVPTQTSLSTPIAGDSEVFESAQTLEPSAAFDPINQKVVIAYRDVGNSNYGTAVVGTVSNNTITFGTPVVFESDISEHFSTVYDSANQKIVIAYRASTGTQARAIVGTVTGDTITFGSSTGFCPSSTSISAVYDSANQKVVIAYRDNSLSNRGTAVVGTVSGNSISFGTATQFETGLTIYISATYDSANGKVVVAYADNTNFDYGTAAVGTVSGTSISFGTPVVFNSGTTLYTGATYDSANGKVVIAYRDGGNNNYGTAVVGTVSGTSISFGTPVVFESDISEWISAVYDSTNQKVVIVYVDSGNLSYGTAILGTVSGTSISFGTPVVFESGSTQYFSTAYDPNINRVVVAYRNNGNNSFGTAVVLANSSSTLNDGNYIGIAAEAISNGATGKINIIGGINNGQTGLTVARKYYTNATGGIGLTPSNPSVVAGVSISSTEIIVKGSTETKSSQTYYVDVGAQDITPNISGGTVYNPSDGLYQVRVFESPGTLTISNDNVVCEYVLVAGGGASDTRGGGGAGGAIVGSATLAPGTYPIGIGTGGTYTTPFIATNGSNTTFNGLTAIGGGAAGSPGGSGGGWPGPGLPNLPNGGADGTPGQGYPGNGGIYPNNNNNGGGGGYGNAGFPYYRNVDRDTAGSGGSSGTIEWGLPDVVGFTSEGVTHFSGGGAGGNPVLTGGAGFAYQSWGGGGSFSSGARDVNDHLGAGFPPVPGTDGVAFIRFKKLQ